MRKVALVSGAAQGIGLAIARRLGADGATILLSDVQGDAVEARASELRTQGHDAHACAVDTSDEASVQQLLDWTLREVGPVEILINNAAISGLRDGAAPLTCQTSLEEWNRVIGVNLTGAFLMCRAFAPGMIERGHGRIVNIASAAGRTFIPFAPGSYSAAKAGVIALTWKLAHELGPSGITVNSVAPGRIETPMNASLKRTGNTIDGIPLRRAGTPEDIADTVLYLVSDQADYVTGSTIDVHGGLYM